MREVHHNFFIGNYNALYCIDTDDGSCYLHAHHNFLVSAGEGLKSIVGGHDMHHTNNIFAYLWGNCWQVSGGKPGTAGWSGGSGFNDSFVNNTCIPTALERNSNGYPGDCGRLAIGFRVANNSIHTLNGSIEICGMDLQEWQQSHPSLEVGTTVSKWPSDDRLIAQARALLDLDKFL
jgi:hypothetical protein